MGLGFCLGCWKSKELEERYALGNRVKFMLCNACRKTHLTKNVIPKFEQIARQPPQAVDRATQVRIRNGTMAQRVVLLHACMNACIELT